MSVIERMLGRDGDPVPGRSDGVFAVMPMRRRDLKDGVYETERHAYPRPWSPSVFQSELEQVKSGSRYYVVARRIDESDRRGRGAIAGHAGLWFTADEAHITNIAVHPNARRNGAGKLLMLALADEAIRRGCVGWTLEVRLSSVGAQQLYARFGFEAAGIRKRYYENTEDAIVMWCNDIQSSAYRDLLRELGAST